MRLLTPFLLLFVFLAAMPGALAQASLGQAKADGLVGERPDGLVGIVAENAPAAVRSLVEQVNEQRMAEYRRIAEETDAPLEAVQARAGRQIIQNLPSGQYFQDAAGRWRRK